MSTLIGSNTNEVRDPKATFGEKRKTFRDIPEYIAFKEKWDGKIPRREISPRKFAQYLKEFKVMNDAVNKFRRVK